MKTTLARCLLTRFLQRLEELANCLPPGNAWPHTLIRQARSRS